MMLYIEKIQRRLASKLIFMVGLTLLITISAWLHFNIKYQKEKLMDNIVDNTDRLTNTIRLGTHYAMMLNSRDDINQIINNIARQPEFENIRIYNKKGQIKFSSDPSEVNRSTNIRAEACDICHRSDPPLSDLGLGERTRILNSPEGYRLLGIISPICNEPGCNTNDCHVHPEGKKILGALDVVVSLEKTDRELVRTEKGIIGLAVLVFIGTSAIIFIFVLRFVNQPVKKLIDGTRRIAKGEYSNKINIDQDDEMGLLAGAINHMGDKITKHRAELNRQRDEYQNLFESVPCLITVQDRNYRLLKYNKEFLREFDPEPDDFCYHAYKGRDKKCETCPVELTFEDGRSHHAEESGLDKNKTVKHWSVRTSPIFDDKGNIAAAMEISHDISERKHLETELEKSEEKYHAIFSNIPNPVFVLDLNTLEILNCNKSVETVYGFIMDELIGTCFTDLFQEDEKEDDLPDKIKSSEILNQVKQKSKTGKTLFVNIRISPSEYSGQKVLLITTSDITKRLEAEQQLIQASKMATLGEMATGVAHELNQPLSVIKTVSSFCIDKIAKNEEIRSDILSTMLTKVDNNVDRATRIINHMRQFARKSDMETEKIRLNDVIENAIEIFSQQLKVKGIELVREIDDNLPKIHADPSRLEQVLINLLINARDAIEEKRASRSHQLANDRITIKTGIRGKNIIAVICDTGPGIPQDILDKIFEPFFTTKEVGKGTGLGLSISYGIVRECGGTIEAGPNNGNGACFIMRFPIPDSGNTNGLQNE